MIPLIVVGFVAFLLSYLGVLALRRWAQNGHALDLPNSRSSHTQPTPRGGGLIIVIVTLTGLTLYSLAGSSTTSRDLWTYILGAILIAAIGWIDDIRSLPFWLRIIFHSLSAILIIVFIGFINEVTLPIFDEINLGWLGIPLTFLLIIGLINAYNFMDGIDGLAGLQATIGGFAWMVIGLALLPTSASFVNVLLGAASLGFLVHNWSPARIFMGDVGSTFLGFTFAVLIIIYGNEDSRLVVLGMLILWPFIFDTTFTFLRRIQHQENIFEAHRSHLYQRLIIGGYSHSLVSLLYVGLSVIGILLGISWYLGLPQSEFLLVITVPVLALGLYLFVLLTERRIIGIKSD